MNRRCPVCGTEYPDEIAFCGQDGNVTIQMAPDGVDPDERLGEQLGDYIVAAHIADGAMGAVYEARNAPTRERVAIKVLHPDVEADDIAVERFKREYETADMFEHPHIVKVLDYGETAGGQHYMTMEFLEGQELGQLLRSSGKQTPARAVRMLCQVALALDEAHSFGVIHRDLKPDNIYLCVDAEDSSRGDDVRILDFGSVKLQVETGPKLTAFGTTLGSPYYMSPEQAKGLADVDTRTDVFAMGAILYEMLTGKVAFDAPTVAEILMKIVREMPTPADELDAAIPAGVAREIEKAIAKDKAERHESPTAMIDAVLAAYGVSGDAAEWAAKPQGDLQVAIDAAPSTQPAPEAPSSGARPEKESSIDATAATVPGLGPPPAASATPSLPAGSLPPPTEPLSAPGRPEEQALPAPPRRIRRRRADRVLHNQRRDRLLLRLVRITFYT